MKSIHLWFAGVLGCLVAAVCSCHIGTVIPWADADGAATYYVSVKGADSNSGTLGAPFATIQKAADVMKPGDTCCVREGTYRETVRPANSGTAGRPIVFRSYRDETAVVTGTDRVTDWTRDEGDIYKTKLGWDLGKNNQIFFDGKMVYEARWPNKVSGDLLVPDAARIDSGDADHIICQALPENVPDDGWNGAVLWGLTGLRWTSWTVPVEGYDAAARKLKFQFRFSGHHSPSNGGVFYLTGTRYAFDAPNEWYFDKEISTMYLRPPGGADPNGHEVEVKRRMLAFDLHERSHVQIKGFNIHAATLDLSDADHCLVQGVRATYISHTRGGNTIMRLGETTGIVMSGHHNVLRDSEIAYSVGDGVRLGGTDSAVINCYIHDINYIGCYGLPVHITGVRNLLSHTTIRDAGRSCISIGRMMSGAGSRLPALGHIIQYNDVSGSGRICADLAAFYTWKTDGGGTQVRYNWFHDVAGGAYIYLDAARNYMIHHNVTWDMQGKLEHVHLLQPTGYNLVVNNTIFGNIYRSNFMPWSDRMYGDVLANSLITGSVMWHRELAGAANEMNPGRTFHLGNFMEGTTSGRDAGIEIEGITDGFAGAAPDRGAYEHGLPPWRAGHDFDNPPDPVYELTPIPFANKLRNGALEDVGIDAKEPFEFWRRTHAGTATDGGGIAGSYGPVWHRSCRLSGPDDDGIEQTVIGLRPNTRYVFAGFAQATDAKEVRLGVKDYGGPETYVPTRRKLLQHRKVVFTTGPTNTSATVYVLKVGKGTAHADSLGVIIDPDSWVLEPGMVMIDADPALFLDTITVPLKTASTGDEIRYALNGAEPTADSPLYAKPLVLSETTTIKASVFRDGRPARTATALTVTKVSARRADRPGDVAPGLLFKYYEGEWEKMPDFDAMQPLTAKVVSWIDFDLRKRNERFGMRFEGYIKVSRDGVYKFHVTSDDGGLLWIGDQLVVNNGGLHRAVEASGTAALAAGLHPIKVEYFEFIGREALEVAYEGPGIQKQSIPPEVLFHETGDAGSRINAPR